jgi:hypothetical protein
VLEGPHVLCRLVPDYDGCILSVSLPNMHP